MKPPASIVIPTRDRRDYLKVALASIEPQTKELGAEIVVVEDDRPSPLKELAEKYGARYVALGKPHGPNTARNTGVAETTGELVVFLDDDVEVKPGWLSALLEAAETLPHYGVFGGPIEPQIESRTLTLCGREGPPVTFLDLGDEDCDAEFAWGANMAVRRSAFEQIGPFEEAIDFCGGDEEEWERRYKQSGGKIRYVAGAGVYHRRVGKDATLRSLARSAYRRGRNIYRYELLRGDRATLRSELRILAGCLFHTVRYRCTNGLVLAAHETGRLREALRERVARLASTQKRLQSTPPAQEQTAPYPDFLSGESGYVKGVRAVTKGYVYDTAADLYQTLTGRRKKVLRAAASMPPKRKVLALALVRSDRPNLLAKARSELMRSRHDVDLFVREVGSQGKFENLNELLAEHPADGYDWLLLVDDDVTLASGFLDGFLFLAERFDLKLAQPAQTRRSHAAWRVTRRRLLTVARQTQFVEIGPVVGLHRDTFDHLLPFPQLTFGWGLDAHWAAVCREQGWRQGVIDTLPVEHTLRPVAGSYPHSSAVAEAREFLAQRPYLPSEELQRTLVNHRSWE